MQKTQVNSILIIEKLIKWLEVKDNRNQLIRDSNKLHNKNRIKIQQQVLFEFLPHMISTMHDVIYINIKIHHTTINKKETQQISINLTYFYGEQLGGKKRIIWLHSIF